MTDLFEYLAAPLRVLISAGDVSAEVGELFLASLAWIVPVIFFVLFGWCMYALLAQFIGLGGAHK